MIAAMRAAGFTGLLVQDGAIFGRTRADLPEFSALQDGDDWCLSLVWPLRATAAQVAGWTDLYPDCPMDTATGETRIQMLIPPAQVAIWAERVNQMVAKCTIWRRASRHRDEGM